MIPFPNLSPEIFTISLFGMEFALRWYAMAYIVGLLIAWWLAVRAVKRVDLWPAGQAPMQARQVEDLMTWIILGVILGGRLGYVLFYQPAYYLANPTQILRVWEGGMAFHGGLIGVIVAAWIYSARHGINRLSMADLIAHTVAPGLLLGRLSNFINAELWGRATTSPFGVIFPGFAAQDCGQPVGDLCARHPSQLYEAGLEGLLLGAVLLWLVYVPGAPSCAPVWCLACSLQAMAQPVSLSSFSASPMRSLSAPATLWVLRGRLTAGASRRVRPCRFR